MSGKHILILTDSLGLPRNTPEVVDYKSTWPVLVRDFAKDYDVIQVSLGGGTLDKLFEQSMYYKHLDIGLIIIQSGIVDCAPRAFHKIESQIISRIPFARFLFKPPFVRFLRKFRKISYTKPSKYEALMRKLKGSFNCPVIALGIVGRDGYESISPGIFSQIDLYNKINENVFGEYYLPLNTLNPDGIMSDYHHLNELGHRRVFEGVQALSHKWMKNQDA